MILFYLNSKNKSQARIIRNLYRNYLGVKNLQATSRFNPNNKINDDAKLIVFAGILRGEGLIYRYCKESNKNFLYVDHAYLERGYNFKESANEWMRITPNAFTWAKNQIESPDRWNQYFGSKYQLSSWNRNNGSYILALPPSNATKVMFPESSEWMERTLAEISTKSNLPIKIREKPLQVTVDPNTNQVIGGTNTLHQNTIEADMLGAKLIVTFNSAVPVLGTILGIPCYCSPYAAAYPMNINLSYINNPPEPNRQAWLNQLVHHQYTSEEMKSGKVWELLAKYLPK
jgi:hypothetical protein